MVEVGNASRSMVGKLEVQRLLGRLDME